jgi:Domain of unknown function (DUF4331)
MSKYYRAADLGRPGDDPRLDLTDLYVFAAPFDRGQTVLIIDVSPAWNGMSRVPPFVVTSGFHPDTVYRINVDNDGDVEVDVAFSFVFSELSDGAQTGTAYYATGSQARRLEPSGEILVRSTPVGFGADAVPVSADDCRLFIGVRSDPFFIGGAPQNLELAGRDPSTKKTVLSVALQVPNDRLLAAGSGFSVWATVSLRRHDRVVQVDRAGHPSSTPFMKPNGARNDYNAGHPSELQDYLESWTKLLQDRGYRPEEASTAALAVLPDVLTFDTSRPATYPNGRLLTDDVFASNMPFLTHGTAASQPIGPRDDLLAEFPFLGPPDLLPP